jgi:flagellar biogenesis protein FliO
LVKTEQSHLHFGDEAGQGFLHGFAGMVLFMAALMLIIAAGMYVFAQMGQKIGAQQTFMLHQIYEEVVGSRVEIG